MNRNDSFMGVLGLGVFLLMMIVAMVGGSNTAGGPVVPYNPYWFAGSELESDTVSMSGDLAEGESATVPLDLTDRLVRNITATLTWQDEDQPPARRVRRHTNQPDSFTLALTNGNLSESNSGANPQGGEGSLVIEFSLTDQQLADPTNINWTATVTMDTAGMWLPNIGVGLVGLTDRGNAYSIVIEYEYYPVVGPGSEKEG